MSRTARRLPLSLLVACFVFIAGCDVDALTSDTIFLTHEFSDTVQGESIHFTFSGNDLSTGRLQDVNCDCSLNIADFITGQGFQPSDLVSATLISAEIIMLFPISEKMDFLDQAILKFTANGVSATEVANISSFSATQEVNMSVLPNRDIGSFLEQPQFGAILQVNPATLDASRSYDLSIILKVRLELQDSI